MYLSPVAHRPFVAILVAAALAAPAARADPQACIAQSEQAQQARTDGRLRTARDLFRACATTECPSVVQRDCQRAYEEVDHAVPTIVLIVRRGARDVTDVHVFVDGIRTSDALDGRPLAFDPGPHRVRIENARGALVTEQEIVAHEAEKNRIVEITIPETHDAPAPSAPGAEPTEPEPDARHHTAGPWILVGVGLAAAVTGVVLFAVGRTDIAASEAGCAVQFDGTLACPGPYTSDGRDRSQLDSLGATLSNAGVITMIGGGVVLVGGLVWHFVEPTGPARVSISPVVGPSLWGASARIVF